MTTDVTSVVGTTSQNNVTQVGIPGPRGNPGPQGIAGDPGPQGGNGAPGTPGVNGATIFTGSGAPSGASGANGDMYIDTATGDLYGKSAGSWAIVGNVKGPTGSAGPTGATGPAGVSTLTRQQCALTLTSGTPYPLTTVTANANVLLTPNGGNLLPIRNKNTGVWSMVAFTELTNILANSAVGNAGPASAAANNVYDGYAWDTDGAGTLAFTRSPTWASGGGSNQARGTGAGSAAIQRTNGIITNAQAITNGPAAGYGTLVGTLATDAGGATVTWDRGSAAIGGGRAWLGLWNADPSNRRNVAALVTDTDAPHNYTSATVHPWNASNSNRITCVRGLDDDPVTVEAFCQIQAAADDGFGSVGIGVNSIAAIAEWYGFERVTLGIGKSTITAKYQNNPGLGLNFFQALEASDGSNANTFTAAGGPLRALIRC